MNGEELYLEGVEQMRCFYKTAPYGGCGGMHSVDYKDMIIEKYFIPAANAGCVQAMKECGDYYLSIYKAKAIKFYRLYMKNCPKDKFTKTYIIAKLGLNALM